MLLTINQKQFMMILSDEASKSDNTVEREVIMQDVGMTNEQYKGMLLDELEDWQEVLELAREENNEKIIKKAEKQIAKINEKLKF